MIIGLIIIVCLLALACIILTWAYADAERECRHMKRYTVVKPGVKFIRKSWLRKQLEFLAE